MQRYKIILQYEGTKYQGWQRQTSTNNTIQGKIEAILTKLDGRDVEINGAGRTDAGVHALGQVADFVLSKEMSAEEVMEYLNQYLPEDIAVISIARVDDRFHSRLQAKGKHYRYRIHNSCVRNVFTRRETVTIKEYLDIDAMREAAELLSGKHDFAAFTSTKKSKKSTVRDIQIRVNRENEEIVLDYTGDGFLFHMVRILTGTLVEVGKGERKVDSIPALFEQKVRENSGVLMPAEGLCLVDVLYQM